MKKLVIAAAASLLALSGCQDPAGSGEGQIRNHISMVGSSTVFPFAKKVSETFANAEEGRASPVLESTGTGGGMQNFCAGLGGNTPDIVNASRRMKKSEFDRCVENGVTDIIELQIGIDGIAVTQSTKGPEMSLSDVELYRAIGAMPFGSENRNQRWSDIRSGLPGNAINVFGPPKTSGTRDALEELILTKGCETNAATKALKDSNEERYEEVCHQIRTDGPYVDTGENDNLIIQKLDANPDAVGIFSYSYLEENMDKIRAIPLNGVAPTYETISSGEYVGARPLFIYIKKDHVGKVPGLKEYVEEFLSAGAPDGYLKGEGLITSPEPVRKAMQKRFADLATIDGKDLK